jgi:RND family efflux transporter MFP subunit
MRPMRKVRAQALVRWLIIIALLGGGGVGGFVLYRNASRPGVTVTQVVEAPVVQAFYATGTLQPLREFPVKSNVEGILVEVLVDKGEAVKAGQKIASVKVDELEYRYKQAAADFALKRSLARDPPFFWARDRSSVLREFDDRLKATNEQLENARRDLKRFQDRLAQNAANPREVEEREDRVTLLASQAQSIAAQRQTRKLELGRDLSVARAALDIAEWNLSQQTIRSPIDGVVLERPVSAGTRVGVNAQITVVADVSPANLVMRADVDEEDKTKVREGMNVRMTLYAFSDQAEPFVGKVERIYPKADPVRRTFEVDVRVAKAPATFAAGMTGELAFVMAEKDQSQHPLVVPSQAVQGGAVWVVRDGRAFKTSVQTGLSSVERTEIVRGLNAGDRVVISPTVDLRDGQTVRVTGELEPAAAAGLNRPKEGGGTFKGFAG